MNTGKLWLHSSSWHDFSWHATCEQKTDVSEVGLTNSKNTIYCGTQHCFGCTHKTTSTNGNCFHKFWVQFQNSQILGSITHDLPPVHKLSDIYFKWRTWNFKLHKTKKTRFLNCWKFKLKILPPKTNTPCFFPFFFWLCHLQCSVCKLNGGEDNSWLQSLLLAADKHAKLKNHLHMQSRNKLQLNRNC